MLDAMAIKSANKIGEKTQPNWLNIFPLCIDWKLVMLLHPSSDGMHMHFFLLKIVICRAHRVFMILYVHVRYMDLCAAQNNFRKTKHIHITHLALYCIVLRILAWFLLLSCFVHTLFIYFWVPNGFFPHNSYLSGRGQYSYTKTHINCCIAVIIYDCWSHGIHILNDTWNARSVMLYAIYFMCIVLCVQRK